MALIAIFSVRNTPKHNFKKHFALVKFYFPNFLKIEVKSILNPKDVTLGYYHPSSSRDTSNLRV